MSAENDFGLRRTTRRLQLNVCERRIDVDEGTMLGDILAECTSPDHAEQPIAALVNNEVRSLASRISINATIVPLTRRESAGQRVYRSSLCHILALAAHESLPEYRLLIGHSLGNGYYYSLERHTGEAVTETERLEAIDALRDRLREIVAEDRPIERAVVAWEEAKDWFAANGMQAAALLVARHNYSEVPVYRCGTFMEVSHGPLVVSTGVLSVWDIEPYGDGFLLVFPAALNPDTVDPGQRSATLYGTYREYKDWGRVLGVSSAGELNQLTESGDIAAFIRVNETLQRRKIAAIADQVDSTGAEQKVVLVAGPSSSGKTTFTKKLALQLTAMGYTPIVISLDDYFVPRERTPRGPDGNYDFERLEAIDVALLNDHLVELFAGGEIEVPRFNFKTGQPEFHGTMLRIPERGILLMEGIHGLNSNLTPRVPHDRTFRIYTSALTQLNLDDHTRIATTDNRLIRRMVRDHQYRGHTAEATLSMWQSVRRGEDSNIFPFQDSADATFNSALDYELGVLRAWAEPLLRRVKPISPHFAEAARLQAFLRNFSTIPDTRVPDDSILREFIGGSSFSY